MAIRDDHPRPSKEPTITLEAKAWLPPRIGGDRRISVLVWLIASFLVLPNFKQNTG